MENRFNSERMIRYLLGELSTDEQVEMETEYFYDPEKFNLLQTLENDLIEGYVNGKLSNGVRERFEAHYLSIPSRREQVQFFQSLAKAIPMVIEQPLQARVADQSGIVKSKANRWQSISAFFSGLKLSHRLSYAAAVAIIIAGVAWQVTVMKRQAEQIAKSERERAEQQKRDQQSSQQLAEQRSAKDQSTPGSNNSEKKPEASSSPDSIPTSTVASVTWTINRSRSVILTENVPRKLRIKPDTGTVRLTFNLPVFGYNGYGVSLQTLTGQEMWKHNGVKSNLRKSGEVLVFTVPAKQFRNETYLVVVSGNNLSGKRVDIGQFYLDVTTGY